MTRYALVRWGKREVNNELKEGLLGSDRLVLSTTSALDHGTVVTAFCIGVRSASGILDLKSEKRFP